MYNQIKNLINANEDTVIVTWDTLHLSITLLVFIALVILIWINRLDRCVRSNNEGNSEGLHAEENAPRCIDADNSVFV